MCIRGSLWVYAIIYFALGFFNILFAWLGMIDFLLPLFLAIFGGNKFFCNHLCGRGQLFSKLGTDLKCSRCKPTPRWMSSKWFRYGFLLFFLTMFGNMVFQTYLVAAGAASLREAIKLFWTFRCLLYTSWKKGKRTHVFIDEFHVVFENEFLAQFFNSAWRQFRKRNAYLLQLDFRLRRESKNQRS